MTSSDVQDLMEPGIPLEKQAALLTQALPYIQRYRNRVIVVKYGGSAMVSPELKQQVMEDIALLDMIGVHVVLVHGGGPEINAALDKLQIPARFLDGLRVTDKETMDVVQMVLAGKVNKSLVHLLECRGTKAVGLCGIDGQLILASQKDPNLGYVGRITKINVQILQDVMDHNYVPVISTLGCDTEGNVYNINADTAAAYIAGAMGAERLFMMTDTPGVLRDQHDPSSLIRSMDIQEAVDLFEQGIISGGMIPKIECCIDAIHRGVNRVIIMDGRASHSLLMEILTSEGVGTMIMERNASRDENSGNWEESP